jgi:hypothetical protein
MELVIRFLPTAVEAVEAVEVAENPKSGKTHTMNSTTPLKNSTKNSALVKN